VPITATSPGTRITGLLALLALLVAATFTTSAPAADASEPTAPFVGTVSEIVDTDAETGIPRRWMRQVGDPAPDGYSHGYQWGSPSIVTPPIDADTGPVTLTGTLDVADASIGDFGLIGLFDTATLAAGERGLNEGAYIYAFSRDADTLVLGLSDGRGDGGEYVQVFNTIDLTVTDRVFDVTFTVDPTADALDCATDPVDVATAEGCLTLEVDGLPTLTDSYGTITNEGANGGVEFGEGATAGWDGLASATAATGFDYDLTVSPVLVAEPQTQDDCKQGGWEAYGFANQGQCIKSVVAG
jgi:hypothetical protein